MLERHKKIVGIVPFYMGIEKLISPVVRFQPDSRLVLAKLVAKYPADVDSAILLKILKAHWKGGKQGNTFRMAIVSSLDGENVLCL